LIFSPLSLDDIFRPSDFVAADSVIAAVSGGGDSVALLLLLQAALVRLDNPPRLVAITVDHALRASSAAEARGVGALCAARGIAHETFVWQGKKPKTGLAQQARLARYHLLVEAAQKYKANSIFTGHTLDDQAETYLMRATRDKDGGKGGIHRGLAAMSRLSQLFSAVKLIRPLLQVRRADLRHFLQQNGVGWIEDPSNEDQNYERVRVRASLNEATIATAIKAMRQASLKRRAYNAKAVTLLSAMHPQRLGECYVFEHPTDATHMTDIFLQLVSDLAALVGGATYLRQPSLSLQTFLTKKEDVPCLRLSWSGSIVERHHHHLLLWREQRNLSCQTLPPQSSFIWDGRYLVSNKSQDQLYIQPPRARDIEKFLKSVTWFSDKNCDKNKELEQLDEPSETKIKTKTDLAIMAPEHTPYMSIKIPATAHLATPVFTSCQGIDIPLLQKCFKQHRGISLTRILAPYEWLISEDDLALVHAFKSFFSFTID